MPFGVWARSANSEGEARDKNVDDPVVTDDIANVRVINEMTDGGDVDESFLTGLSLFSCAPPTCVQCVWPGKMGPLRFTRKLHVRDYDYYQTRRRVDGHTISTTGKSPERIMT